MITNLIRLSLSNRLLVVLASAGLLAAGIYVYAGKKMPVDVFPDFTAPTVTILTEAHGMAPTEVETLVTFPIEAAMNGAAGVRRVRSSTSLGFSVVWVEFDWGTDIKTDRQIVAEKLSLVRGGLPPEVDQPIMAPQASAMGEVLFLALRSESRSAFDVRTLAETTVRRRLLAVEGVAQVTPIGGELKQYQVVLSPSRLQAYKISTSAVSEALRETNENATAGVMVEGGQEFVVQGMGRIHRLEHIADTVVTVRKGVPIRVGQLGHVQIGPALKRGDGSAMGQPAVVLSITKQPQVNTLELTNRLDEAIDEIEVTLPKGVTVHRNIFRQADFIESAVGNVKEALFHGGLLVVIIVLLFLGNLRASAITLIAIPMSLLTTVLVLKAWGASINTMTLGGMAIAIGALVDDAVVDVENVFRRLRENARLPEDRRRNALQVVFHGSMEIRNSIVFATAIVILVFLPLFFLSGVEGRLLQPLAVAYIVALLASLVVAVTITPVLCLILLPHSKAVHREKEPPVTRLSKRIYRPVLNRTLNHPWLVGLAAITLFLAAVYSIPGMGLSFLPEFNEGSLTLGANTMPGTSLQESNRLGRQVEEILMSHPEVVAVGRKTGRAELSEHALGVEGAEIEVSLDMTKPLARGLPQRSKEELMAALRNDFASIPGMNIEIGQPISHRINHMLSGNRNAIAVKLFAPENDPASLQRLRQLAQMVQLEVESVPNVVDLVVEQQADIPIMKVAFDRAAIQRHGLRIRQVSHEIERAFAGETVSSVFEGRNAFDLVVRVSQQGRFGEEDIHRLPISTPSGAKVPLGALAKIERDGGPNTISRENVQRKIVVSCNVAGRDVGSVVADIRRRVEKAVPLGEGPYSGYYVQYGGQFESAESASNLLLILGLAVLACIFLLLQMVFRSVGDAVLIMLSLLLAMIGGILGVYLSGGVLSLASLVGFITLLGIATRNGIMLVSHIRYLQTHEGVTDFREAVRRGSVERLAPVLMTALTTGLGLMPLALSGGQPGNEIQTPLAIVVLCGLFSSTLLNMIVVPSLFLHLAGRTPPNVTESLQTPPNFDPNVALATPDCHVAA
ncbi:MAG: efflux RND transporter permease subunit [Candidatus Nealsonbacteria bacterium]|nr:efflux RND transporter permease subunit [Candidatus Nealsonbacteria bacterium]